MKIRTTALLLAGGKGLRMGHETPKQFLNLQGRPVVLHTLEKFQASEVIDEIVLVLPEDRIDFFRDHILGKNLFPKLKKCVAGGFTRQDSTHEGFKNIDWDCNVVIVHDVARPLVTLETIRECVKVALDQGASLAATPASDTIKECDESNNVVQTHKREKIFLAQTPQAARFDVLRAALEKAYAEGFQGTDEASLIERIGQSVKVVPSPATNIKLTQPSDFIFAEAILKEVQ